MKAFTFDQLTYATPDQISALAPSQLRFFSADQVVAITTTSVVAALTSDQLTALGGSGADAASLDPEGLTSGSGTAKADIFDPLLPDPSGSTPAVDLTRGYDPGAFASYLEALGAGQGPAQVTFNEQTARDAGATDTDILALRIFQQVLNRELASGAINGEQAQNAINGIGDKDPIPGSLSEKLQDALDKFNDNVSKALEHANELLKKKIDDAVEQYHAEIHLSYTKFQADLLLAIHLGDATKSWDPDANKTLKEHFDDHASDPGINAVDPGDYARKALAFLNSATQVNGQQVNLAQLERGIVEIYDSNTRLLGAYNFDGTIRSFFYVIPDANRNAWLIRKGFKP